MVFNNRCRLLTKKSWSQIYLCCSCFKSSLESFDQILTYLLHLFPESHRADLAWAGRQGKAFHQHCCCLRLWPRSKDAAGVNRAGIKMVDGESAGSKGGKVVKAAWLSQRSGPGGHLPAHLAHLKNTQGKWKGKWENKTIGWRDGVGYMQVTSWRRGDTNRAPMMLWGWEASSGSAAAIWELTGRG